MAREGFYNQNEFRDYPFLTRIQPLANNWADTAPSPLNALPHEAIVDFGAIMGIDSEYAEPGSWIYLYAIRRSGDTFSYEFRTTAAGAADEALVFTRDIDDVEFTIQWVESTPIASLSRDYCFAAAKWEGYLVTGRYADLALLLPGDGELLYATDLWHVEPSRIQSLIYTFLRSISLANFPRTQVITPQCDGEITPPTAAIVNKTCMYGELAFKEGYNCTIQQNALNNTISIGGNSGGGAGMACAEVPRYQDEPAPTGSRFLTGGPSCGEVVKTVNGVGGRTIQLTAGPGFTVAAGVSPNTLIISMDLGDFATCLTPEGVSDVSLGSV